MIIRILVLTLFVSSFSFQSNAQSAEVKVIEVPEMLEVIAQEPEKIKVINFWATWCKPCVEELPYFIKAANQFPEVEFIFVSLDFSEQVKKVKVFANKKGLNVGALYLIDDVDYNSWIDRISPKWGGAIPATLIVTPNDKFFYEQAFHEGELNTLITKVLNKN